MIRLEYQLMRDDTAVQECPTAIYTIPEQAEERAMQIVRLFAEKRSVINFEDKTRLIIDFFGKDWQEGEHFIRRVFTGEPSDLFSILRAVLHCRAEVKKENQKPPQ